jgi:YHS domain-containing protein
MLLVSYMTKDPVCGMDVDPSKTPYKTVYKGEIYYFCSSECKKAFEKDPEHYLIHGPRGMPSHH